MFFLTLFFIDGLRASTQSPPKVESAYPFLLYLRRSESGSSTCVLLQRAGGYHLERSRGGPVEVFEGDLPREQLVQVVKWVDDDTLQHLTQKDVAIPLFARRIDLLGINIFRGDHWQKLEFIDPGSRKRFPSLDPLVSWLEALHKLPARRLSEEEGKNNCQTPGEIKLKLRPDPADGSEQNPESGPAATPDSIPPNSPPTPQPSYLVLFEKDLVDAGRAARTCLVVYPTGRYHAEKSSQEYNGGMTSRVYEGRVNAEEVTALHRLLDDPAIKTAQHGNLPPQFQAAEITTLVIPRPEGMQRLVFAHNFAVRQGDHWNTFYKDPAAKIAEPIENWAKSEFRPSQANLLKNAQPTNCSPH